MCIYVFPLRMLLVNLNKINKIIYFPHHKTNIIIHDIITMFIVCFIDKNKIISPLSLVDFDKITVCLISDGVLQSQW